MLKGQVGNDLIGVHVQRGAGTTLEYIERELVHAATLIQDLVTGPHDGLCLLLWQHVQATVGHRGSLFDLHHAADEVRNGVNGHVGNLEVIHRADGVDTKVSISGNFQVTDQIGFRTSVFARRLWLLLLSYLFLCRMSGLILLLILRLLCGRLSVFFFFLRRLCHDGAAPLPVENDVRVNNLKRQW